MSASKRKLVRPLFTAPNQQASAKNVLEQAQTAGVSFTIELDYFLNMRDLSSHEVTPAEIFEFLADPLAFRAKVAGVTISHYEVWYEYHFGTEERCTGTNKDGKPCKNRGEDGYHGPAFFIPGWSDRCNVHQDKTLKPRE